MIFLKFFQGSLWVHKLVSSRHHLVCAFLKVLTRQGCGGPLAGLAGEGAV